MSTNQFAGQCTSCGTTVEAGTGTCTKDFGKWLVQHIDCTPTALTRDDLLVRFEGTLTASQLDTILAVNLTEDEIDDATGIVNQAGVDHIALVAANNAAYEARRAESAARFTAAQEARTDR